MKKQIEQVNLRIILQGRILMSEQECSKNSNYDHFTMRILSHYKKQKVDNQIKKIPVFELLNVATRKSYTVFKNMVFNKEQVKGFLETPTTSISPAFWKTLPLKVRLEKHAEEIVHDCNGLGYELQLIEL